MLADVPQNIARSGSLDRNIHLPSISYHRLLEFIAGELPRWRDYPGRPQESSEQRLTDQLCSHLNSAARRSQGWDFIQFRTEVPDETNKSRSIDLAPKPCGATVWIDGRHHSHFDTLLPMECKRLPTPTATDRDEREYVISRYSTTGGIQRFKLGAHGAAHNIAAMIAYIQRGTAEAWSNQISEWIRELASLDPNWNPGECPAPAEARSSQRVSHLRSRHQRSDNLTDIDLEHLWIEMN